MTETKGASEVASGCKYQKKKSGTRSKNACWGILTTSGQSTKGDYQIPDSNAPQQILDQRLVLHTTRKGNQPKNHFVHGYIAMVTYSTNCRKCVTNQALPSLNK